MALSGMQIYKLLPRTNCKDCGFPTCLAFAMKVANKKAEVTDCPHASKEAIEKLGVASEPLIREIVLVVGDEDRKIGNENVVYRHEKTFINPTVIAIKLSDTLDESSIREKAKKISDYQVDRIGMFLDAEAFLLANESLDGEKFKNLIRIVHETAPEKALILHSGKPENLKVASELAKEIGIKKPVFSYATKDNYEEVVKLAESAGGSIVIKGDTLDDIIEVTGKLRDRGFKNIIIDFKGDDCNIFDDFRANSIMRRSAVRKEFKELGFPIINYVTDKEDIYESAFDASLFVCKYASIIVLDDPDKTPESLLSAILILRQNIYTDPQKPIQVEAKVYEIGEVDENTPVYITTNFSLTYFLVAGEIECTGRPAYLAIVDAEGMGVLTAWAAEKFNGEIIGEFIKKSGLEDKLDKKRLVIPGYLANIKGETEDELPKWEVLVGPAEAVGLPFYIKSILQL